MSIIIAVQCLRAAACAIGNVFTLSLDSTPELEGALCAELPANTSLNDQIIAILRRSLLKEHND